MRPMLVLALLAGCGGDGDPVSPDQCCAELADASVPSVCGVIETVETGDTIGASVHVAVTGSDETGTGAEGAPFATIQRAAQGAAPGTNIVVHAGTYDGDVYLEGLAGTADAPIWIGGAPGEALPVISGGAEGIHLTRARYVVLHHLEVTGATANGINADDGGDVADEDAARHLVFRDLSIHDIGGDGNQDCLKLSGLNDYWVLDSSFARCGGAGAGSGIDHVGCHRGVIARNDFRELSGNAVQAKGGSFDLDVRQNLMVDAGERAVNLGGSTGLEFFRPPLDPAAPNAEARRIHVYANVIVGGTAAVAFVGCVDCVAANNTIVDPGTWVARILQETSSTAEFAFEPARDGRFINNLVYFTRASVSDEEINVGAGTDPASFVFAHNLWYAHDAPDQSAVDTPVAETNAIVGVDPMFADAEYRLAPSSPAAGAGYTDAVVRADKDGRCWADPPSIGAYEVIP